MPVPGWKDGGVGSRCFAMQLGCDKAMESSAFLLKLGDGSRWHLLADPGTSSWIQKFAMIMQLKTDDQDGHSKYPRMFFTLRYSGKGEPGELINLMSSKIEENLPRSGWKAHDLRSLRFWSHRAVPDIICEIENESNDELDIIRMWTLLSIIYLRLQDSGGLPLHAALVGREGRGVLLAGSGGTGKSTLCRLLPRPWCALSDDQALVVRDDRKRYLAHPIPTWSDYLWRRSQRRWDVEHYVPLAAIFFIEQARSDEVVPIGQGQAAVSINHSSTDVCRPIWWNLDAEEKSTIKKKIFDNACQLARAIPAYILRISLTGRFWKEIERVL